MGPLNLTCLHCLQRFCFEHLFNLLYRKGYLLYDNKSDNKHIILFSTTPLIGSCVISACVAAAQCRPVLHYFVVILLWFSWIMDCMLLTFDNRVPLMGGQW